MNNTIIEITLIICGFAWIVLFFLWLVLGRRAKSKTGTIVIDTVLIVLSLVTMFLAMLLRQEYTRGL